MARPIDAYASPRHEPSISSKSMPSIQRRLSISSPKVTAVRSRPSWSYWVLDAVRHDVSVVRDNLAARSPSRAQKHRSNATRGDRGRIDPGVPSRLPPPASSPRRRPPVPAAACRRSKWRSRRRRFRDEARLDQGLQRLDRAGDSLVEVAVGLEGDPRRVWVVPVAAIEAFRAAAYAPDVSTRWFAAGARRSRRASA
jgi:hypothetical protein